MIVSSRTSGPGAAAPNAARRRARRVQLGAYKLAELARIEGIHYQTALARKARGFYVAVIIRSGRSGKGLVRFLTADASRILREALEAYAGPPPDLRPEPPRPELSTF